MSLLRAAGPGTHPVPPVQRQRVPLVRGPKDGAERGVPGGLAFGVSRAVVQAQANPPDPQGETQPQAAA